MAEHDLDMTTGDTVVIRCLSKEELVLAFELSRQEEGWFFSLERYCCINRDTPGAVLGAFTRNGQMIGTMLAVPLVGGLAYINGFVIHPEYRGRGIGRTFLTEVLKQMQGRNVILDSVNEALHFYPKFGFQISRLKLKEIKLKVSASLTDNSQSDLDIVKVSKSNMAAVMHYDQSICQLDRSDHMPKWLLFESCMSLAAFQNGECVGYTSVSYLPHLGEYLIMPLYANSTEIAHCLLMAFLKQVTTPCTMILFVVKEFLGRAVMLSEKLGGSETTTLDLQRMCTQADIMCNISLEKIYSVNISGNTFM